MIELPDYMLTSYVFVSTDMLIDKRSQRVFVAKLTMVEGNGGETQYGVADETRCMEGIFTPDSVVENKHQMLGASVLSRVTDGHILEQMMNISNNPVIIKEGTFIGSFKWLGVSNEMTVSCNYHTHCIFSASVSMRDCDIYRKFCIFSDQILI